MICFFLSVGAYHLTKLVLTSQKESRRQQHWLCSLYDHSIARRETDEEDIDDFQDVGTSGGKSHSCGEDHKEVKENDEVSASSSQISMDDIRRPSGLGPLIKKHAKLVCISLCNTYQSRHHRPHLCRWRCLLSCSFISAAQAVLCGNLAMRDIWNHDTQWSGIYAVTWRNPRV